MNPETIGMTRKEKHFYYKQKQKEKWRLYREKQGYINEIPEGFKVGDKVYYEEISYSLNWFSVDDMISTNWLPSTIIERNNKYYLTTGKLQTGIKTLYKNTILRKRDE